MPDATDRNRNTVSRASLTGVRNRTIASAAPRPNALARLSPTIVITTQVTIASRTSDWTKPWL